MTPYSIRPGVRLATLTAAVLTGLLLTPARADFGKPFWVSGASSGFEYMGPKAAMDPDGGAVFVWQRYNGSKFLIEARAGSVTGVLGPIYKLSSASSWINQGSNNPQVAVDVRHALWPALACIASVHRLFSPKIRSATIEEAMSFYQKLRGNWKSDDGRHPRNGAMPPGARREQ